MDGRAGAVVAEGQGQGAGSGFAWSWIPATLRPSVLLAQCWEGNARPEVRQELVVETQELAEAPSEILGAAAWEEKAGACTDSSPASDATDEPSVRPGLGEDDESASCAGSLSSATDGSRATDLASSSSSPSGAASEQDVEQPEQEVDLQEAKLGKPNFAGTWKLVQVQGDLDRFLSDMRQPWLNRSGAKGLKYGVGRVVVECRQEGDNDLWFAKVLCDPRVLGKSKIHVAVGQGELRFLDDLGRVTATSRWEGRALRFDARADSTGLAVTLLIYYDEAGNLVEEMTSCKGTVAKYIFNRSA